MVRPTAFRELSPATHALRFAGLLLVLLLTSRVGGAQVLINAAPFTYGQTFDYVNVNTGLNRSGTIAWTNNSTLPGWYTNMGSITASAGGSGTGAMYSFGAVGVNDRALGGVQTNGTGAMAYGVRLQNQTVSTFRSLTITFDAEQWRNGGETAAQVLYFMYRVSNLALTSVDATTTNYDEYYEVNVTSPVNTSTAGALVGNDGANRYPVSATLEINLPPNAELMLKWVDPNDSGFDHGLALDNVEVTLDTTVPAFETVTSGANFSDYFDLGVEPKIVNQENQPNFQTPTNTQLANWGTGLDQAAAQNYATAYTTLSGLNYKLIRYTLPEATYTVLRPTSTSGVYWGFYFLNPAALLPNLALQVPHPLKDFRTPRQGSYLFEALQAYSLAVSGHNRCMSDSLSTCKGTTDVCGGSNQAFRISDPAHNVRSYFHRATTVLAPHFPSLHFVQLHGFTKDVDDPHFIISNGTYLTPNPDRVQALGDRLSQTLATDVFPTNTTLTYKTAHLLPDTADKLLATTNVQGRFLNTYVGNICTGGGAANQVTNRFTHIEQYFDFRADARNYPTLGSALQHMFSIGPNVLPVELTSFRAQPTERQVLLTWTVATEKHNESFTVERSTDAEHYQSIGTVLGAGNSLAARSYALADADPLPGLTYYRLKQTDFDGTTRYPGLTSVHRKSTVPTVHLYPSPNDGHFTVEGAEPGSILTLLNALGNPVRTFRLPSRVATVEATDLRKGVYFAQIAGADGRVLATRRVVVE